jgi:hypothetical protein
MKIEIIKGADNNPVAEFFSSPSTPETDAFTTSFTSIDDLKGKKQWVPSDFARKLERERDEARNKMADALQEVDLRTLDFERMKEELHAARAEAAKWEAIAFWEASANSSTNK